MYNVSINDGIEIDLTTVLLTDGPELSSAPTEYRQTSPATSKTQSKPNQS